MGFFDFLRDKQDTSPEEIREQVRDRITEIRKEIRSEEIRLDQELAQRLRNRFETLWLQSRAALVESTSDEWPSPSSPSSPASEDGAGATKEGSETESNETATPPVPDPPHAHLRDALWALWERTRGRCQKCDRSRGISFVASGQPNTPITDRLHLLCTQCQPEKVSS
ncbi:MAG: hypothetical protein QF752_07805 [Planctomycetota bacterium]|jgi:hypothetical protein|nr:hypothetical protein [Planctomycetota bacterium]